MFRINQMITFQCINPVVSQNREKLDAPLLIRAMYSLDVPHTVFLRRYRAFTHMRRSSSNVRDRLGVGGSNMKTVVTCRALLRKCFAFELHMFLLHDVAKLPLSRHIYRWYVI